MDKEKLNSFLSKIYDDSEKNVELNNAINVISDIMGDVSDEELMSEIKKYGIDKLKGFDTDVLGKEVTDELSDVPTDIKSKEYDEYVRLRNPTEDSKREYGQRVSDAGLKKSKSDVSQRKKDVDEYSNFIRHNPYQDLYKNDNVTEELNSYDVKGKLDEYQKEGMSKEDALIQVRKDIDSIRNRQSTFGENLRGRLTGLGQYLLTPKMAEDYYVQTGKTDDNELMARAGLGTALNVLEMHPTNGIGRIGKALVYAGKPVTESVRTNIYDSEDTDVGGAIKDAAMNTGLNVLFDVPQILPEVLKQQAGLGGILEKAKPIQSLLEGIQEADKLGNKKTLGQQRDELRKVYKDYFDIDIDDIKKDVSGLKTPESMAAKTEALKNAMNERIPDINDRNAFKEFQTRTAKGIKELEGLGENLDDFDYQYLSGKSLNKPIDSKTFHKPYETDRVVYEKTIRNPKYIPTKDDIDELAKIYDRTFIKHPKIAKVTKSGIPSGILRGVKSDTSSKENNNQVKSYVDYLKNDELALRMWKAGFTPHDLTKEQKEKINDLLKSEE